MKIHFSVDSLKYENPKIMRFTSSKVRWHLHWIFHSPQELVTLSTETIASHSIQFRNEIITQLDRPQSQQSYSYFRGIRSIWELMEVIFLGKPGEKVLERMKTWYIVNYGGESVFASTAIFAKQLNVYKRIIYLHISTTLSLIDSPSFLPFQNFDFDSFHRSSRGRWPRYHWN